jgi:Flp pilus assembly protein TadD
MHKLIRFPWFVLAPWLLLVAVHAQVAAPLDEARAALKAGDLARAAALLEPLTGPDGKDAAAWHTLGLVRLAQKNAKEAVESAEKATTLDATQPAYFSQLGIALSTRMREVPFMQQPMLAGKLRKAFARAVELDPNDLGGLIGLTRFYAQAPEIAGGSPEKAREFAQRVQRLDPFLGAQELGELAAREEKFAEALEQFEAAAKLRPGSAGVQSSCGLMLAKLGRKEEARTRFEAALKLNPALGSARQGLAALDAPAP